MRVENIRTEKDIVKFLDTYYFKGNKGDTIITFKRRIDTSKIYYIDSLVTKYLDSKGYPIWIKDDFNTDGKSDLIFCGFFDDESRVISFVSDKNGLYTVIQLSNRMDRYGVHFIYKINKSKQIILGRVDDEVNQWDSSYHLTDRFKRDTIEYRNALNGFIDYRYSTRAKFSIDTIKFKLGSFKKYFNDDLVISNDGYIKRVQFRPIGDSKGGKILSEKYLPKDFISRLFNYVNRMPLDKYDSAFTSITKNWLDGMWINTSFSGRGGLKFKFSDFLQTGPLGFQRLYDLIMGISRDTNWTVIETVEIK